MTQNILDRLREAVENPVLDVGDAWDLLDEAADRIEELEAAHARYAGESERKRYVSGKQILRKFCPAPAVPDGYVMVPDGPQWDAMVSKAASDACLYLELSHEDVIDFGRHLRQAMLALKEK